jgi:hypothetical protein
MTERSCVQTPTKETIFRHHSFESKLGTKFLEKLKPGIVACALSYKMGVWTLMKWLIKNPAAWHRINCKLVS